MKRLKTYIFVAVTLLISLNLVSTLETSVNVPEQNFPPIQLQNIPDQFWPINKNITNSFDLDDYFKDYEDFITYNFTSVENITIIINETTNTVSFYSDYNFTGERNVTFIASDGFEQTLSNLVRINVTSDDISPNWHSLNITPTDINQNTLVSFSANWTDNIQLSHFVFSINQGSGWVNYSQTFTGTSNISSYSLYITASGGTNVLWRFYAYDTSNNYNSTSIEYFTVNTPTYNPPEDTSSPSTSKSRARGGQAPASYQTKKSILKGFEVIPDNLAVELKQGESLTKLIKINNLGLRETNFSIEIKDLEEFMMISDNNFSIKSGGSAVIAVLFKTNRKSVPDIYFGKLIITTAAERIDVPVIVTVNPLVLDFEVKLELDEKYKVVRAGDEIEARISLYNKKDLLYENITIYYSVMDFFGQIVDFKQEEINFSEDIIRLNRNISLPADSPPGDYIFYVRATKENKISMDLEEFILGEEFNIFSFIISNIIYLVIALIFVITLLLFIYYHKTKEKERLLNLYIMINELKKLVEEDKLEQAVMQYNRIKLAYHERIDKKEEQDKEEIKKEMQELVKNFNELNSVKKLKNEIEKSKAEGKEEVKEDTKEENKEEVKDNVKEEVKEEGDKENKGKNNDKKKINKKRKDKNVRKK